MQIKDSSEESQVPVIICTNQILSEEEAGVMRANSWLYHYYMVQSRLQYGLAYGAHSPAGLAAYYPHMLGGAGQPPQGFSPYDPASVSHSPITPAYLSAAAAGGHHSGFTAATASSLYPGYHHLYTPAATPAHYHLPPQPEHSSPAQHHAARDNKDHGPLDFSKDYSSRSQDYNSSQQSSPSLRSDSSSSPVYHPPHESLYGAPEVAVLTQAGRHASISDHHYKAHHRSTAETQTRHRDHQAPPLTNPIGFWSDTALSGFDKYKPETEADLERGVKRVKKETDFYNSSDSNNNSDGPPTYYSLDQLHLQQHH